MIQNFVKINVTSSIFKDVKYSEPTQQLRVVFSTGKLYEYEEITNEEVVSMETAESAGKQFNVIIKNKPYKLITNE